MPPLALLTADPAAGTLLLLALVWLAAKVGGELASRLKLPGVVGELGMGMALAALYRAFPSVLPNFAHDPSADLLASVGVVVLMFAVGLESTVPQMMKVGMAAFRVAVVGVVLPMAFGLVAAKWLLPAGTPLAVDLFIGACLCATSIGISARVLKERGASESGAGRVILGAAVIDDVLGLLVLAFVTGLVKASVGGAIPWGEVGRTLLLAVGFLALALSLGRWMTPHFFRVANRLRVEELLLPLALAFGFLLAWGGSLAGLAPIVGAYAAGLILEPTHIRMLEEREEKHLEALIHPLVTVLAPVFFVIMGAKVDPRALLQPSAMGLALLLTLLGSVGKYLAGFAAGKGFDSHVVGWGMLPRGEVGLIFVATGAQLGVLSGDVQAAVVVAMLLTTVIGPIGLSWRLRKAGA